jgi:hypothetical protein
MVITDIPYEILMALIKQAEAEIGSVVHLFIQASGLKLQSPIVGVIHHHIEGHSSAQFQRSLMINFLSRISEITDKNDAEQCD